MNKTDITMTIFIIEDNKIFARMVAKGLEKEFPTIVSKSFATGEEMLAYIEANPEQLPTIYILDYYLNSEVADAMDGGEILAKLVKKYKDLNKRKELMVIMLTSNDKIKEAVELLQKGASHYIVKDENPIEALKPQINQILDFITITQQKKNLTDKAEFYKKQMKYAIAVGAALGLVVIGFIIWYFLKQ